MAVKAGVITDVIDVKRVQGQIDMTVEGLTKVAELIAKTGVNVKGATGIQQQTAAQKEANKAMDEAGRLTRELARLEGEQAKELAKLREQVKAKKDALNDSVKAERVAVDSIKAMDIEIKKLTKAYDDLSRAERNSAKGQEFKTQINSLRSSVRDLRMELGDTRANVGNYRQSLDGMNVTVNEGAKRSGIFKNALDNLKGTFQNNQKNAGNMESSVGALGATMRMMPGPIGAVSGAIANLGQMLKMGAIGVGIIALTALIWGITKAHDAWRGSIDATIQLNIDFLRQIATIRAKYKEYIDELKGYTESRSRSEIEYSKIALLQLKAREKAAEEHSTRMNDIDRKFNDNSLSIPMDAYKIKLAETAKAEKDYKHKLDEIEKATQNANASIITNAATTKDASESKTTSINKTTAAIERQNEEYERQIDLVNTMMARLGLDGISAMKPKEAASVDTGATPRKIPANGGDIIADSNPIPESKSLETDPQAMEFQSDMENWNNKISIAADALSQIDAIVNASYQNRIDKIDQEAAADEQAKERELRQAAGNTGKLMEINNRYDAKEKEREKEKRRIQREQAKYQKTSGTISAIINTAVGVTGSLAQGGILGIILAALTLAAGIAEIAVITSQPLPSYRTGRQGGKGEFANINEAGQEAVVTKDGNAYFPTGPVTYLPEGSSVIPHDQLVDLAGKTTTINGVPAWVSNDTGLREEIAGLHAGFTMLAGVVRNKRENYLMITDGGIKRMTKDGNTWTEWINNNVKL